MEVEQNAACRRVQLWRKRVVGAKAQPCGGVGPTSAKLGDYEGGLDRELLGPRDDRVDAPLRQQSEHIIRSRQREDVDLVGPAGAGRFDPYEAALNPYLRLPGPLCLRARRQTDQQREDCERSLHDTPPKRLRGQKKAPQYWSYEWKRNRKCPGFLEASRFLVLPLY